MVVAASLPTGRISLTPRRIVMIDGVPYHALTAETQHAVDQPRGTATVRLVRPDLTDLRDRWLNRPIEIQLGYDQYGGASRVFSGHVRGLTRGFDRRGFTLQIKALGWAARLDFPSEEDVVFPGGTRLYDIVRSLCARRGLPMFGGELITDVVTGAPIRLGGVEGVDEGNVIIPRRTSWLQWIVQKLDLFGYKAFDRPDGTFWWQLVAGQPTAASVDTFQQGRSLFLATREDTIDGMVTWWGVDGASWTDEDGIANKIRSFPAEVPPDPGGFVTPPGYVRAPLSDSILVTQELADASRHAREISTMGPREWETARFVGKPALQPGNVATLTSPLLELDTARRWVMSVDHSANNEGIRTTWAGWTGVGAAQPAGDDAERIPIFTGYRHVGNEYLSYYGQPAPQGREITFEVEVPDTYTAFYIEGWIRGSNSYLLGGPTIDATVSKLEAWQGESDKPVGTATLPSVPESEGSLQFFRLPLPGRLEPGTATIKAISGEDSGGGPDDFEGRDWTLVLTGRGYPVLPTGGS